MTANYTVYEHDVMNYHRSSTGHKTWHWTQIPEQELFHAGYITDFNKFRLTKRLKKHRGGGHLQEFGLDGLSFFSNTYHGIQAKKYNGMITEKKRPSCHSKDDTIKKLGDWIQTQKKNYAKNMKNDTIRQEWETFVEEYKHFFIAKKRKRLDEPS